MIKKLRYVFLLSIISVVLFCIYLLANKTIVSVTFPNNVDYDDSAGHASIDNLSIPGLYQYQASPNKNWIIYSATKEGIGSNISIYDKEKDNIKQITNHQWMIPFDPAINDNGDFAYAQNGYSTSASSVILNEKIVFEEKSGRLGKATALSENYLVFGVHTNKNHTTNIYVKPIAEGEDIQLPISGFIKQIYYTNDDTFLINAYGYETKSLDIWQLDAKTLELNTILATEYSDIVSKIYMDGRFLLDTIIGENDTLYMFNAYWEFYDWQRLNPFSMTNDFGGRLSWNQSRRLEGLIELYTRTGDSRVRDAISLVVKNIMQVTNGLLNIADEKNPAFLWASQKYSPDKQAYKSGQANNGSILYSLLKCVNAGVINDSEINKSIIQACKLSYDFYEKRYTGNGCYTFSNDAAIENYDGVWMPFNQQNLYGLMLLELYKNTGDNQYKLRCHEMAMYFRNYMIFSDEGQLMWHYWPDKFYEGWVEEDNISINNPNKNPTQDLYMEDYSHSSINVKFILEYYKLFPNDVFTQEDIGAIRKTANALISEDGFYRHINGKKNGQTPSFAYMPVYAWGMLDCPDIDSYHSKLGTYWLPDFDRQSMLYTYAVKIPTNNKNNKLTIQTRFYSLDGSTSKMKRKSITVNKYFRAYE